MVLFCFVADGGHTHVVGYMCVDVRIPPQMLFTSCEVLRWGIIPWELERWLISKVHWSLFQRTWVQLSAPTRWLLMAVNSSSKDI